MDDDIQFLGMVSPVSPHRPYVHPSHPPLRPPASGIMLVIPKTGDEPTQTLRFLKSRSTVVHIGRASSSLADAEKSPDTIQFRCPVISRRHAKLMFSSGHVYIVDLHSHHGTHLLRRDEIVSRPILPDVPIVLQDGDTLTFGKAVGKEPYSVSPITANVMLIYDTEAIPTSPVSPPIISLVDSPPSPTTPIKGKQPVAAPKSSSSGRYGLFGPHSPSSRSQSSPGSSEDDDFSQSDHDGEEDDEDEEDDYPDLSEDYPATPFGGHGQAQSTGACYAPLPSLQGLGLLASRHVMHHAPPTHMYAHAAHTHMNMHAQSLSLERRSSLELWFDGPQQRIPALNTANASHEVGTEEPMDISSPPSPAVANLLHDVPEEVFEEALASVVRTDARVPEEPPIIGAYPGSPPWLGSEDVDEELQSEFVPTLMEQQQQQQQSSNPELRLQRETPIPFIAAEETPASSVIAQASESHLAEEDAASDIDADGEADVDHTPSAGVSASFEPAPLVVSAVADAGPSSTDTGAPAGVGAITASGMTMDARLASLDEALVNLWGNVLRMQIAHRKTQTDHKLLSDRTEALTARLDTAQADLRSAVRGNEDADALRVRVQAAENLLAELQGRLSSAEAAVAEAKAEAESRVAAEEAAAAAVAAAAAAANVVVTESEAMPVITTTTPTRKRKRAENCGDAEGADDEDDVRPPKALRRKRGRRFTRAAMHTAAAAAVGAVAAWSALAFA